MRRNHGSSDKPSPEPSSKFMTPYLGRDSWALYHPLIINMSVRGILLNWECAQATDGDKLVSLWVEVGYRPAIVFWASGSEWGVRIQKFASTRGSTPKEWHKAPWHTRPKMNDKVSDYCNCNMSCEARRKSDSIIVCYLSNVIFNIQLVIFQLVLTFGCKLWGFSNSSLMNVIQRK